MKRLSDQEERLLWELIGELETQQRTGEAMVSERVGLVVTYLRRFRDEALKPPTTGLLTSGERDRITELPSDFITLTDTRGKSVWVQISAMSFARRFTQLALDGGPDYEVTAIAFKGGASLIVRETPLEILDKIESRTRPQH